MAQDHGPKSRPLSIDIADARDEGLKLDRIVTALVLLATVGLIFLSPLA